MMRKVLGILFFYILLAVLLLPRRLPRLRMTRRCLPLRVLRLLLSLL